MPEEPAGRNGQKTGGENWTQLERLQQRTQSPAEPNPLRRLVLLSDAIPVLPNTAPAKNRSLQDWPKTRSCHRFLLPLMTKG